MGRMDAASKGIPETSFSCEGKLDGGFYGDPETGCKVFHRCFNNGTKKSFLCNNQTLFHQQYLVCDWQANVDCSTTVDNYTVNERAFAKPTVPDAHERVIRRVESLFSCLFVCWGNFSQSKHIKGNSAPPFVP